MRKIRTFKEFSIFESSAAGNRESTYELPFKHSSNDPKQGYSSKSFVDDLKSLFLEKPFLKSEITSFISRNLGISNIDDLATKPFALISEIIQEIERIIEAGEYEPELTMPGGALLFIRNKTFKDGKGADFYINRKGTKIEVVSDDKDGTEKVEMYEVDRFPYGRYEFTQGETDELKALIRAKKL
jgi:hypothetical protein